MIEPDSGRIPLNGRDTATIAAHELRRGIGYVIQRAGPFPHKTVLASIATVPPLTGRTRRQARAGAANPTDHDQFRRHFPYSTIHTW